VGAATARLTARRSNFWRGGYSDMAAPTRFRAAAFSTSVLRFPAFSNKYSRRMVAALLLLRGGFR